MVHSNSHSDFQPAWRRRWWVAALLCSTTAAWSQPAQPAARTSQPDPTDARARVPTLAYVSSLQPDARPTDRPALTWREANDSVARIGGWRVYAREAQLPDVPPSSASAPIPPTTRQPMPPSKSTDPASMPKPIPMPAGHGGHKTP